MKEVVHSRAQGVTLIELLVVFAIIGVLAAIILPVISSMEERANITQCASNLRQIGIAMSSYVADHSQRLPVPCNTEGRSLWQNGKYGYVAGLGYLQYYGYFAGIPNVALLGSVRSPIFHCPTQTKGGYLTSQNWGDYWYNMATGDTSIPNPLGPSVASLSPGKSIAFDYFPINASSGTHANLTSVNCLYLDGSVLNINQQNFKTNSRITALDR